MALNIGTLNDTDYAFLLEFRSVMRPIAEGLTALEGNNLFGSYLPHLFGIKAQLDRLKNKKLNFCEPLLKAIDNGFYERFQEVMDPYHIRAVPLYLAMMTNPKYKLSYMGQLRPTILQKLKNMLLSAAEEISNESQKEQLAEQVEENMDCSDLMENEDEGKYSQN